MWRYAQQNFTFYSIIEYSVTNQIYLFIFAVYWYHFIKLTHLCAHGHSGAHACAPLNLWAHVRVFSSAPCFVYVHTSDKYFRLFIRQYFMLSFGLSFIQHKWLIFRRKMNENELTNTLSDANDLVLGGRTSFTACAPLPSRHSIKAHFINFIITK